MKGLFYRVMAVVFLIKSDWPKYKMMLVDSYVAKRFYQDARKLK